LEITFCVEALHQALIQGRPEIFNTDQGAQLTATAFTQMLAVAQVQLSMDSKGRRVPKGAITSSLSGCGVASSTKIFLFLAFSDLDMRVNYS